MRDRLIAWLWPALRPLVLALIAEHIAAEKVGAPAVPARRHLGGRPQ